MLHLRNKRIETLWETLRNGATASTRMEQTNYVPRNPADTMRRQPSRGYCSNCLDHYIGTKGHIVEYFGGLSASKCAGTVLGVTFKFPSGKYVATLNASNGLSLPAGASTAKISLRKNRG